MTLPPEVVYRWWQDHVSYQSIDVLLDGGDAGWFQLNDDGSHKWRYMTNLRCDSDVRPKEEFGFVLRNLDETAELWLKWFPWTDPQGQTTRIGTLHLTTTTASMSMELSEEDCMALTESMRKLMYTLSAPEERQIQAIGTIHSSLVYTVTEQIYSSPIIRSSRRD